MNTTLTETQKSILIAAAEHPDHRLDWFPENIKGGARAKVLGSLQSKGLVEIIDDQTVITRAGLAALGLPETPTEPGEATTHHRWKLPPPTRPRCEPCARTPSRPR